MRTENATLAIAGAIIAVAVLWALLRGVFWLARDLAAHPLAFAITAAVIIAALAAVGLAFWNGVHSLVEEDDGEE